MEGFNDDKLYNDIALRIIDKGIIHYQDNDVLAFLIISPGLPIILSLEKLIFGNNWFAVFIINSILSGLLVFIVYRIAIGIFDRNVAILSALWASIYFMYIRYVPTAGKEVWICLLFILLMGYYIKKILIKEYSVKNILLLSIFMFLMVFVDERYLAYLPFLALCLLFARTNGLSFTQSLKNMLIFSALVVFMLVPWIYRTYKVTGEILILTPRTSHITSKIFRKESRYDGYMKSFSESRYEISEEKIDSIMQGYHNITNNAGRMVPEQQYDAIINYGKIPYNFTYLENVIMSFRTMWKPIDITYNYTTGGYRFDGKWSFKHNLIVCFCYGILLPFLILGWILLYQKNRKIALFFLAIIIYHTLIHIFFIPFTRFRYRIPIDFIIIILGCKGIWFIINYFKLNFIPSKKLFRNGE